MRLTILLLAILISSCSGPAPTKEQALENLKSQADQMVAAFAKNDFDAMANLTLPNLVKSAGGKEKYIDLVKQAVKSMADIGMTITSAEHTNLPTEWTESHGEYFALILTLIRMNGPDGSRMKMNSGLIAVSNDRGRTWRFVDANSKKDITVLKKFMPNFPDNFKLPKITFPTIDE